MFLAIKDHLTKWGRSSLLRLTFVMTVFFAVIFVFVSGLTIYLVSRETLRQVDLEIQQVMEQGDSSTSAYGTAIQVFKVDRIDQLPREISRKLPPQEGQYIRRLERPYYGDWRIIVMRDQTGWTVGATNISRRDETLEVLTGVFQTTGILALLAILGFGGMTAYAAQRRFDRIAQTLRHLADGDLNARTGIRRDKDDLDSLAANLDHTADRLDTLIAQTRHLGANIAHDLRTPLARLRSNLEQLSGGDDAALEGAFDESERMAQIIDAIMRIARIEASKDNSGFEHIDLGTLVREVFEIFDAVVEDQHKHLEFNDVTPATVFADKQLLVQALANLIQNAITYGGDKITIFANKTVIGVTDNGQGVTADQYDHIIRPMARLDAARQSEGAGLGLAMVKAIADRHGATLKLGKNDPSGLCVAIIFEK